ncbi:MAG: exosortase system-associated protein, TIGR04073 family [Deltaproteobacteria bacterium]|nr:exosortase system-associated protein, TIGR04073 family [Deltaproteobacteria bacterium]
MKKVLLFATMLLVFVVTVPNPVRAEQQPEMIAEKMAVKFTRGLANTFTSVVELPKQTVLTVRDMGAAGYLIGPIKGVGMTIYRGFVGVVETVFCVVPQPGYYDPLMDPPYVWQGWEPKRDTSQVISEGK